MLNKLLNIFFSKKMKKMKNKSTLKKKMSLKKKLENKFPKIYKINRILDNNKKKDDNMNILIDNISMPKDFEYYMEDIIKIANLWNTSKELNKRCSFSSKGWTGTKNNPNKLSECRLAFVYLCGICPERNPCGSV